jgi:hypothetical protein
VICAGQSLSSQPSQEAVLASLPKEYRKIFWHCLELIVDSNEDIFLARVGGNGKD